MRRLARDGALAIPAFLNQWRTALIKAAHVRGSTWRSANSHLLLASGRSMDWVSALVTGLKSLGGGSGA